MIEDDWWIWDYIGERENLNQLNLNLASEQIENYLINFMDIWNNDWFNAFSDKRRDGILNRRFHFNCGSYSINWMIRLGECISYLRDVSGFDDEMINRLRNDNNFESAATELDYSSCFQQAGMELELQPLIDSKKGDGKLTLNGRSIFYEVINQGSDKHKREEREIGLEIYDFLKEKFGTKRTLIRFKNRKPDADIKLEKLKNILKPVIPPFNYEDEDLEIQIMDYNGGSTILGDILNREKRLEKWIKKVHKKYKQLPPNVGGVIIANSSRFWDPQDIEIVSKTSWRETKDSQKSRISGIIFCNRKMLGVPSLSGERINFVSPQILINPYSKFDYKNELKEMASAIGSFPDWM